MDRLVWVGAFPSEDNEDVRSIVAAAIEVGFDSIVLATMMLLVLRSGRV